MILVDYEKVLGVRIIIFIWFSEDFDNVGGDRNLFGVLDYLEIFVYVWDKYLVGSFKEKYYVFGNKIMFGGFNWNFGENLVDEVFYKGEEGL